MTSFKKNIQFIMKPKCVLHVYFLNDHRDKHVTPFRSLDKLNIFLNFVLQNVFRINVTYRKDGKTDSMVILKTNIA